MSLSRRLFLDHVGQTSEMPLMLEVKKAQGIFIYDQSGKRYFDFNSGINVSSMGHRHPHIISAIQAQLDRHLHTMVYGEHVQSPQVKFAELLTSQLPKQLSSVYYLLAGTEAIELVIKLARKYTGRSEIIACANAYHGSTLGAESLRSDHEYSRHFMPLIPGIRHIDFNDEDQLEKITTNTAAVILEPVQAEGGVIPPDLKFLTALRKKCNETKTLLIFDEIQTGFGRTGELFAFKKYGIIPDVFCIGKSMGGGMPLSGVVTSKEIMASIIKNPSLGHITTFGGHPLSCAAAFANLELVLKEGFMDGVLKKEKFIKQKLQHPIIKEIRSSGMMMAVELKRRKFLKHVVSKCFEMGLLIDYFLFNRSSFRMAPPLIYTIEQLDEALDIVLKAMDYAESLYNKK